MMPSKTLVTSRQHRRRRNKLSSSGQCVLLDLLKMWTCFPLMELHQQTHLKRNTHVHELTIPRPFGLVGYRYVSQSFKEGKVTFRIDQSRRGDCVVPIAGSDVVWKPKGGVERTFHTLPIGSKPGADRVQGARHALASIATTFAAGIKLSFADPGETLYAQFPERYALDLSRHMLTIKDVAEHLQVGLGHHQGHAGQESPASLRQAQAPTISRRSPSMKSSPLPRGIVT